MMNDMAQYKVTSNRLDVAEEGKLVSEKDLPEGTNVGALVEGGHLTPVKTDKAKDDK